MKFVKLSLLSLLVGSFFLLTSGKASAQGGTAPSSQMGVGVSVGAAYPAGGIGAAQFQYAISPGFQVGTEFLFAASTAEGSNATFGFGPYARFILEGKVNPIIQAGFRLTKTGSADAQFGLNAGAGIEYFMSRNAGVYGLLYIIDIGLNSGAAINFGIPGAGAKIGVEWYFDR